MAQVAGGRHGPSSLPREWPIRHVNRLPRAGLVALGSWVAEIRGVCAARFGAVRDALAESLDKDDVGASAAVFVDGEPVVDIWGGFADVAAAIPWQIGRASCRERV